LPNLLYGRNVGTLMLVAVATLGSAMRAAGAGAGMAAGSPVKTHTIFHAFNWRLGSVVHRLGHMREMGYDAVQISPVQKSKGDEWWARYQPISFSSIEGLGSKEDLTDLCVRAKTSGIMVVADLVFNHMAVLAYPCDSRLYRRTQNFL
jgi:glycosidase